MLLSTNSLIVNYPHTAWLFSINPKTIRIKYILLVLSLPRRVTVHVIMHDKRNNNSFAYYLKSCIWLHISWTVHNNFRASLTLNPLWGFLLFFNYLFIRFKKKLKIKRTDRRPWRVSGIPEHYKNTSKNSSNLETFFLDFSILWSPP